MLTSDKVDLRAKKFTTKTKRSTPRKIMILNIPNDKFSKYMKQKLKELKGEITESIIKVEDLTHLVSQQPVEQAGQKSARIQKI